MQTWEAAVNREIGRRVHRVIADLATSEGPVTGAAVLRSVRSMWATEPTGGTTASSARVRCSSSVGVYFARFAPDGWNVVGCEEHLGLAIADLVWHRDGRFVVDEVKSGSATVSSDRIGEQLLRLAISGRQLWGDRFAGVRLVPLGSPAYAAVVAEHEGRLESVAIPEGMGWR